MKIELDDAILETAVNEFGVVSQLNVAVEECAELIDAIMKHRRGRIGINEVITEIADVQIMCAQLEFVFSGNSKIVEMERARKMDRLRNRLESLKKKQ